jgi:lamin tail-like protein
MVVVVCKHALVAMAVTLTIGIGVDKLSAKVSAQTAPVYTFIQHDGVVIECIAYDGIINGLEPDEYVQIYNQGNIPVNLHNWALSDITDGTPTFTFPDAFIQPGQRLRVYPNELHPEWTGFQTPGFSFGQNLAEIWDNDPLAYDVAALRNARGEELGQAGYPAGCGADAPIFRLYPWGAFVKFIDITGVDQRSHIRNFSWNDELRTWIFGLETLAGVRHTGIRQEHLLHNVPLPPPPTEEPPAPTPTPEPPTPEPPENDPATATDLNSTVQAGEEVTIILQGEDTETRILRRVT